MNKDIKKEARHYFVDHELKKVIELIDKASNAATKAEASRIKKIVRRMHESNYGDGIFKKAILDAIESND